MTKPTRPDGRTSRELRPVTIETGAVEHAEGSCLITQGRTRVLVTATVGRKGPSVSPRHRRGLGHGGVRDAPARHARAVAARGGPRQAVRPDAGDPAPDRPGPPRRRRPDAPGAPDGDARLRRPRRGRGDPLRLGDRRVRRPGARGRGAGEAAPREEEPAPGSRRRHLGRRRRRRAGSRPELRRGLGRRRRPERRRDVRRALRRGAGDRREGRSTRRRFAI